MAGSSASSSRRPGRGDCTDRMTTGGPMTETTPTTMKALYFRETGSLANLRVETVPTPRADASGTQALVRVRAAAINPSDPKGVLGKMAETKAPRVPGRDFAGVVADGPASW